MVKVKYFTEMHLHITFIADFISVCGSKLVKLKIQECIKQDPSNQIFIRSTRLILEKVIWFLIP